MSFVYNFENLKTFHNLEHDAIQRITHKAMFDSLSELGVRFQQYSASIWAIDSEAPSIDLNDLHQKMYEKIGVKENVSGNFVTTYLFLLLKKSNENAWDYFGNDENKKACKALINQMFNISFNILIKVLVSRTSLWDNYQATEWGN